MRRLAARAKQSYVSSEALSNIMSFIRELEHSANLPLRAKKEQFLSQVNRYIRALNNKDLMQLYRAYNEEFQATAHERTFSFIYTEDPDMVFGKLGKTFAEGEGIDVGHTNTHKQFIGMMKRHAIANFRRHEARDLQATETEIETLTPLMHAQRGRLPNIFASTFNAGLEGEFNQLVAERRASFKPN